MAEHYRIYHWDTFDQQTLCIGYAPSLGRAREFVKDRYGERIREDGADKVDIVDSHGIVVESFKVG